jgi:hypothetical protein
MLRPVHFLLALLAAGPCFCPALPGAESLSLPSSATRAKVVSVQNPQATSAFKPRAAVVEAMVAQAITNLTGKDTVAAAWASLIQTNDIVGLKVYTAPGPDTGTRPEVVAAVVKGLLAAGLSTNRILIWDRQESDLRRAGYDSLGARLGVRVAGAAEAGYDPEVFYDTALLGHLIYGDLEFGHGDDGTGRKSYVSKLVTHGMTRIINIAPVLNHNRAGVAGNLFSLAIGSVDNTARFTSGPGRLAMAVPEIYALPVLGDRVALSISDALVCQYEGEDRSLLHYAAELNEVRMSRDPVALDVLALQDLERLRRSYGAGAANSNWELYKNAALMELGVADGHNIDVTQLKP